MNSNFLAAVILSVSLFTSLALAQDNNVWQQVPNMTAANLKPSAASVEYPFLLMRADIHQLKSQLAGLSPQGVAAKAATSTGVKILLPLPSGELIEYVFVPTIAMEPALAEKFPSIRTYAGHQLGKPHNTGRFDLTAQGFHGLFMHDNQQIYIDPADESKELYRVYFESDALKNTSGPIDDELIPNKLNAVPRNKNISPAANANALKNFGTKHRVFRFAVSASGEYTQNNGGTKQSALASIVTAVNRVNLIYNRDVAIHFVLVARNDELIFLDPTTDPFTNVNGDDIRANITVTNNTIGLDSYDIGQVLNESGTGGAAGFGVVCGGSKAYAVSGGSSNQAFFQTMFAHEIGHQFRAGHTYNSPGADARSAYEPGNGDSIMSYGGCGQTRRNCNRYFHPHSIEQMRNYITQNTTGKSCGTDSGPSFNNQIPTVSAGADFTIPARTPFVLTGSGNDADTTDALTFNWVQMDLGPPVSAHHTAATVDDGKGPMFRFYDPSDSPIRILPNIKNILQPALSDKEGWPTTNRTLNFRLALRDGKGGVSHDAIMVKVDTSAGPFRVTQPTSNLILSGADTFLAEWDVANTNAATVNCSSVDISLSSDGGETFIHPVINNTANDGSENIVMPNIDTNKARLKVACSNGHFFNISPINFTLVKSGRPVITGQKQLSTNEEQAIRVDLADITVDDNTGTFPNGFTLIVLPGNDYNFSSTTITPIKDHFGFIKVNVKVQNATTQSPVYLLNINVRGVNDNPVAQTDSYNLKKDSQQNSLNVLSNDSDVDPFTNLVISQHTYQGAGSLRISSNKRSLIYTPAPGYTGEERFGYTISDGQGGSAQANVSITIKSLNLPPATTGSLSVYLLLLLTLTTLVRRFKV